MNIPNRNCNFSSSYSVIVLSILPLPICSFTLPCAHYRDHTIMSITLNVSRYVLYLSCDIYSTPISSHLQPATVLKHRHGRSGAAGATDSPGRGSTQCRQRRNERSDKMTKGIFVAIMATFDKMTKRIKSIK